LAVTLAGCVTTPASLGDSATVLAAAKASIMESDLRRHTEVLASDAYEGRAPGSRGEDSTVGYLARELTRIGLRPGNAGSFFHPVPLIGSTIHASGSYEAGSRTTRLRSPEDFGVLPSSLLDGSVDASPVVFGGYGVVAPEHGWDSYRDLDIRGKTVILLWGDPPARTAADSAIVKALVSKWTAEGSSPMRAGRITAVDRGAAAILFVHDERLLGAPYESSVPEFIREYVRPGGSRTAAATGMVALASQDAIRQLIAAGGKDLDRLRREAMDPTFRAAPLDARVSLRVRTESREFVSRNVVARVDGADPTLSSEYVLYTAHWDHLGRLNVPGDQIFNGAADNAGGVAQLLEIAEAFARVRPRPRRTIVFVATAAEEAGLLGAAHYVAQPIYPLEHTLAVINLDGFFAWGRTRDVVSIGHGNSTLDDVLEQAARSQGRRITPDPWPEQGFFLRSDHYPFAAAGVPALFAGFGTDFVGRPAGWGFRRLEEFMAKDMHRPSDEVRPDWDYSGAIDDARLLFEVGYRVAVDSARPRWKATTPYPAFKAAHEALLKRAGVSR
jgi:hypothetical protein